MPLQCTVTRKGVEIKDCYIKVIKYEGDESSLSFNVTFQAKVGGEIFDAAKYHVSPIDNSLPALEQTYTYLKSLDDFSGAVEV